METSDPATTPTVETVNLWELRTKLKNLLLQFSYYRNHPGALSGTRLNLLADLPEDAEMPRELFGLPPLPT